MPPGDGSRGDDAPPGESTSGESEQFDGATDGRVQKGDTRARGNSRSPVEEPSRSDPTGSSATDGPADDRRGRREVEVPESLYRIVTVFSTLLSILLVVLGFTTLTVATTVFENPPASLVVQVLSLVVPMGTLVDHRTALALGVGLTGLSLVAGGAGLYVYGTRFRAPRMRKSKDASAEDSNDG